MKSAAVLSLSAAVLFYRHEDPGLYRQIPNLHIIYEFDLKEETESPEPEKSGSGDS